MNQNFFITGIGTDVGKTVAAAIFTELLEADYWKPVQTGGVEYSDTNAVKALISNNKSTFLKEAYHLEEPMSPHGAADLENVRIEMDAIKLPESTNHMVIEGAGGLMVPLNDEDLIVDMIPKFNAIPILVSGIYLGNINHTLLSVELMKARGIPPAFILFNGPHTPSTESIIEKMSGVPILGRIDKVENLDKKAIKNWATTFKEPFHKIVSAYSK